MRVPPHQTLFWMVTVSVMLIKLLLSSFIGSGKFDSEFLEKRRRHSFANTAVRQFYNVCRPKARRSVIIASLMWPDASRNTKEIIIPRITWQRCFQSCTCFEKSLLGAITLTPTLPNPPAFEGLRRFRVDAVSKTNNNNCRSRCPAKTNQGLQCTGRSSRMSKLSEHCFWN